MDTNSDNDLNDLERRLSAWQPADEGLNPDAMLFAAGRASVRPTRGRVAWPLLAASLALLAMGLGVWLTAERAERLALAQQLRPSRPAPTPAAAPPANSPEESPATEALPPASYLALRRSLEQDFTTWPPSPPGGPERQPGPAVPSSPIPRAWPGGEFFDR